jgi:D-beta-D-heptose 7-phosphate kinase/D-beta-D-heptose 1-phosphate adenosyltransferase
MHSIDFAKARVLVIGDVILDQYYLGKVNRISPEAPVPVVKVAKIKHNLGGAGNVVNNISNLGAESYLLGIAGDDHNKTQLEELLNRENVRYTLIESSSPTINKVRVVGERQQLLRLDFEDIKEIDNAILKLFKEHMKKSIGLLNVIILSDYGKGVCTFELCQHVIQRAKKDDKIVIVDPSGNDWDKYRDATIITPNVKELGAVSGKEIPNEDSSIEHYGSAILKKYNLTYLLVTRSEKGISLFSRGEVHHIPTEAKEVRDVTGAGDTVVATLAVSLASGIDIINATKIANIAAGIVVSKFGAAPIKYNELHYVINSMESVKVVTLDLATRIVSDLKTQKKRIVFTNGCFDILHRGHISYLRETKKMGDILIVGLNSDESVKKLKGVKRPYNNQDDRAELLASLEFVDYVIIFQEETPYNLIRALSPDVLVKGGDYSENAVVGREFAGEVVILPFVEGYSTTRYIDTISDDKD